MDEDLTYTCGKIICLSYYDIFRDYKYVVEPKYGGAQAKKLIIKKDTISSICKNLYFEKIDDDHYREVISGNIFEKNDENIFTNNETGLSFNIDNASIVDSLFSISAAFTKEYISALEEYYDIHKKLKEKEIKIEEKLRKKEEKGLKLRIKKGTLR